MEIVYIIYTNNHSILIKQTIHQPEKTHTHNIIVDSMKMAPAYNALVDPERKRPVPVPMRCRAA